MAIAGALGSCVAVLLPIAQGAGALRIAAIGDCRLESGERLADCRLAYRTVGALNADRSNAVLVLPWYQGTSAQLLRQVGPGKLVDTRKYFVVLIDAIGNGVSTSPSNSERQANEHFPRFTIRDLVDIQHRLVAGTLGLDRLHAVVGISMGGMQVFEWLVAYPDFMKKAVAIVGSPQTQDDDRQRWRDGFTWWAQGRGTRVRLALAQFKPRTAWSEFWLQPFDHVRQTEAIMSHDISRGFGGSMARAAAAVRAELLIATTWGDREVNPGPAFEFAALTRADVLELDGRCGHQAPSCERATLWMATENFLSR